jgi:hypothetical protein
MRATSLLLLTACLIFVAGCGGYGSSGSGTMAATTPAIAQLSPKTTTAGGMAFTLTVNGSNFVSGAAVYWSGSARTTTFVTASQVKASISAADIASAAMVGVYVRNPGGTGIYSNQTGQSSNTMNFTVSP